jgi:hypothetical protein
MADSTRGVVGEPNELAEPTDDLDSLFDGLDGEVLGELLAESETLPPPLKARRVSSSVGDIKRGIGSAGAKKARCGSPGDDRTSTTSSDPDRLSPPNHPQPLSQSTSRPRKIPKDTPILAFLDAPVPGSANPDEDPAALQDIACFFKDAANRSDFRSVILLDSTNRFLSLRLVDSFIANICQKRSVILKHRRTGQCFDPYADYKQALGVWSAKRFDCFCRPMTGLRINFLLQPGSSQSVITNMAQLRFFRWAIDSGLLAYIRVNCSAIDKELKQPQIVQEQNASKARPSGMHGSMCRVLQPAATNACVSNACSVLPQSPNSTAYFPPNSAPTESIAWVPAMWQHVVLQKDPNQQSAEPYVFFGSFQQQPRPSYHAAYGGQMNAHIHPYANNQPQPHIAGLCTGNQPLPPGKEVQCTV